MPAMRVLFVSLPGIGHAFPGVPLAWALRAAGHDVLMATAGDALVVAEAGLPVVDVASGTDASTMFRRAFQEHPELLGQMLGGGRQDTRAGLALFASLNDQIADTVVATARAWLPDLVVFEQMALSGALAATLLGVPAVQQDLGFDRTVGLRAQMAEFLHGAFDRHGVPGLAANVEVIDSAPGSMVAETYGWPMRFVPYNGGGVLPGWLAERPARARIAVTLGTTSPGMNGLGPIERLVSVAPAVDAEFVLALGSGAAGKVGDLPPNVRAVDWIPLNVLLPTCAAVVHHGGSGTTLTALDAAVPQLILPDGADRFVNADAVHDRGAGIQASETELDAGLITRLLTEEKLRENAAEVRAEMRVMPGPADIVPCLVELAAG
jgi:UDP:flavonoid glycosyltransferase YjiC (YdhE family)